MNIFALHKDPVLAAQMHCDKHVVKMILETAQLLCTAHIVLDGESVSKRRIGVSRLRATHFNHPCAIWIRQSTANYEWALALLKELLNQYSLRYPGKNHKFEYLSIRLERLPLDIPKGELTAFAQCMPEEYKRRNPVEGYRQYYVHEKKRFAVWTEPSKTPQWFLKMGDKQ